MKQTFAYSPKKGGLSTLYPLFGAIALIVVPIIYPFSIGFKRFVLVPYPYSTILLVLIGIALLGVFFMNQKKEKALRESPTPIEIEDGVMTFAKVVKGQVEKQTILLADISSVDYDAEDEELAVRTNKGVSAKFDADYFDSKPEFQKFMQLLRNCLNFL